MAWEFVGVSSVVEVTGTSHTLTLPAGVVEGDLLIACFAIRTSSTTAVTRPSEWSVATQSYINQVTANSTIGAASGLMAYCIMGASPPSLTFTHPVNPSVARGQIVAYRNSDPTQASVLDIAGFFRLSSGATSISFAGGTTTQDNDLLVGVVAGGRSITVTNFNNSNGGTSSGTGSNVTAAPAANTWQERADAGTLTGSDTGLSIFDAVDTVAGSVGNFTATASASARHLTMVAAFKINTAPAGTEYPQSVSIASSAAVALSLGLLFGMVRSITSSGSVSKAFGIGKRSTVAGLAAVSRVAGVSRSLGIASSGAVVSIKSVARRLSVAAGSSFAAAASRAYLVAASIASSGAVAASKSAGKVASIAGAGLAKVRKAASRSVAITSAGSMVAQATRAFLLSLSVASSGAIGAVRSIGKRASVTSSGAVSARRSIGKASAIASAALVTARKAIGKAFAMASAGAASIRKASGKMVSVLPTSSFAMQRLVSAQIAVPAVSVVAAIKSLSVGISAASAGVVSASKTVGAVLAFVSIALVASVTQYLQTRVVLPAAKRVKGVAAEVRRVMLEPGARVAASVSRGVSRIARTIKKPSRSKGSGKRK